MIISALGVLQSMEKWWYEEGKPTSLGFDRVERTPQQALMIGLVYMHNQCHPHYQTLTQESSKIAYFRQLWTVWKAVCRKLPAYPFYDKSVDAERAFPQYYERSHPTMYWTLRHYNIFLGLTFSKEENDRLTLLDARLSKHAAVNLR